ncbi:MAG: proline dehydrogenase family protein [Actinobacteria bacterium]|nr:proline dehydrogenase family protein [Actinomycetota bacterium]MBI3688815.1 proline dehydrogenase family protein [Actinomycetota bacterium]
MLRTVILAAARSAHLKRVVTTAPVSRSVVRRYVAGEEADNAVSVSQELTSQGLCVTLDHLGEDTTEPAHAEANAAAYRGLLRRLHEAGLTRPIGGVAGAEVSVKLSAVGQALDERLALDHTREVCAAAKTAGTTVTLDAEDHTTTDSTLRILRALRVDYPDTGAVLQSYLRRTESDCRELAHAGSRVRLCKGAYNEPAGVAFTDPAEVDRSYVRCLNVLLAGDGYPMIATHDPRLIEIAGARARGLGREPGSYEFQMLYGVRPDEQRRLARSGDTVRVYLPYGDEWYGYLMRRLAERPANVAFFLRSLVDTR